MKISIEKIRKEIKIDLSYEDRQFEKNNIRESPKDVLQVNFTLSLAGEKNLSIKGEIKGNFKLTCERCCEDFITYKKIGVDDIFELTNKELSEKVVDIGEKVKEIVLASSPMKILCKEDCKGICSSCGVNLNKETCKCNR